VGDFESNERRKAELAARPYIDAIYRAVYPVKSITRADAQSDERLRYMDKYLHIDTIIELADGEHINLQEKSLGYDKNEFNTVTLEYYNDPKTGEPGDYFLCEAQAYFCGYLNAGGRGFCKWWIIDMIKLRELILNKGGIRWAERFMNKNKVSGRANFFGFPVAYIWDTVIHGYSRKMPPIHRMYARIPA
jgi:hypothetical protein